MFLKILGPAVAATMVMAGSSAMAATMLLIDDFTDFQTVTDVPAAGSSQQNSSTLGIFIDGDPVDRTLTIENTANNGNPENASTLESVGGALSYSNNDNATSDATLSYTSLTGMDLELSGPDPFFFFFEVGDFDGAADFSVYVEDSSGGISEYTELLTPGFDPQLSFDQFTDTTVGGADFNDVVELTFTLTTTNVSGGVGPSPNVDGSLLSISVGVIPLPATGLLLVGSLGFLGGMRKLRRKKAA